MTLSPSRVLASTCIGSQTRSGVVLMKLTEPDLIVARSPAEFDLSIVYHFEPETTTWSSCANPFASPQETTIAVGTSKEVLLYTDAQGRWDDAQRVPSKSDVLDLAWLTSDTLAAGHRNGDLRLWDTRSQGNTIRLNRIGPVCNVRRISDQTLAIHGMSSVTVFDLRMATKSRPQSTMIIDFDNRNGRPRGFDVSSELGLMAIADDEHNIHLHSLRDGKAVGKHKIDYARRESGIADGKLRDAEFGVRCLQFGKVEDEEDVLLSSYGGSIVQWAW